MAGTRSIIPPEYTKLSSRVALACKDHPQVFLTYCYLEMLSWGSESRTVKFEGDWFFEQFGIPQPTLLRHLHILSRQPILAVLVYRSAGAGSRIFEVTLAAMDAVDPSGIKNDTVSKTIIPCLVVVKDINDLEIKNKNKSSIKNDTVSKTIPETPAERLNIFRLYESNIGALTPLLADALRDAEKDYPMEWLEYAFAEAVRNNARSWAYVEAILKRIKIQGFGGLDGNKLSSPAGKTTGRTQRASGCRASGAAVTDASRTAADRINARRRAKAESGV